MGFTPFVGKLIHHGQVRFESLPAVTQRPCSHRWFSCSDFQMDVSKLLLFNWVLHLLNPGSRPKAQACNAGIWKGCEIHHVCPSGTRSGRGNFLQVFLSSFLKIFLNKWHLSTVRFSKAATTKVLCLPDSIINLHLQYGDNLKVLPSQHTWKS